MNTIWKYKLHLGENHLHMPFNAKVLTAQIQHGTLCIWALVDPVAIPESRYFIIAVTGEQHYVLDQYYYVDTFQTDDGNFVGHLFEIFKPKTG